MSRTILIVEDEPHIAAVVALKLERAGYSTVSCASAEEGLRALASRPFGLIIADVHLGGETGVDLAASLGTDPSGTNATTPVLLLTGMGHQLESASLPASVRDVLTKPFSPTELLARAERVMRQAETDHESEPQARPDSGQAARLSTSPGGAIPPRGAGHQAYARPAA